DGSAFDALPGCDASKRLKRGDEFRPTIGIPREVDGIDADEDRVGIEDLGEPERDREEDRVARRNVRDRNPVAAVLGNVDRGIGQRGAAEGADRQLEYAKRRG